MTIMQKITFFSKKCKHSFWKATAFLWLIREPKYKKKKCSRFTKLYNDEKIVQIFPLEPKLWNFEEAQHHW